MWGILTVIHVLVSVLMIMIILLQTGKGAEIGAAFGGGYSQTLFGSSGPVGFLNKLTTVVAIFFMLTSLVLAVGATRRPSMPSMPIGSGVPQQGAPQQQAPVVPGPIPGAD
jgi:preprotein translocase subunit SecG